MKEVADSVDQEKSYLDLRQVEHGVAFVPGCLEDQKIVHLEALVGWTVEHLQTLEVHCQLTEEENSAVDALCSARVALVDWQIVPEEIKDGYILWRFFRYILTNSEWFVSN